MNMSSENRQQTSKLKVIGTDIAGIVCLILVPLIGWLPGPGGIPLLITGLGLLSINHEFARNWLKYVKKHSTSLRNVVFPNITWIQWTWDIIAVLMLVVGTVVNFQAEHFLLKGFSIGVMAGSTTVFLMNRNRLDWLDKKLLKNNSKN